MKRIVIIDFVLFYMRIRVRMVVLVGQQHWGMRLFNSHFACCTKLELARVCVLCIAKTKCYTPMCFLLTKTKNNRPLISFWSPTRPASKVYRFRIVNCYWDEWPVFASEPHGCCMLPGGSATLTNARRPAKILFPQSPNQPFIILTARFRANTKASKRLKLSLVTTRAFENCKH